MENSDLWCPSCDSLLLPWIMPEFSYVTTSFNKYLTKYIYLFIWLCWILIAAMAPHSSTLAWKIPWMEEPGRLQSMGSLRVGHELVTSLSLFTFMHWRRKWKPSSVLAWRVPGTGEPDGLPSMVSHGVRHDWSDFVVAAAEQKQMERSSLFIS